MDLFIIFLYVLLTPSVTLWAQEMSNSYNNHNNKDDDSNTGSSGSSSSSNSSSGSSSISGDSNSNNRNDRQSHSSTKAVTTTVNTALSAIIAATATSTATTTIIMTTNNNHNEKNMNSVNSNNSLLQLRPSTPSITHFVNDSFIIFCAVTIQNKNNVELKWFDAHVVELVNTKGRVHVEKKAGLLALVFEHIALIDKGNWTCEASINDVKDRKSFELLVNQKISFDNTEMVQSAREGRDATVYCLVKGDPPPEISWLFNGEYINTINSTKHKKLSDGLFIKNVTQRDAGEYTCRAMRITQTFSDSDQITILLRIQHKPQWFDNETALLQYAYVGGSVNISCDAMGEPPPSFTWLHDGHAINGNNYRWFYADYGSTLQIHVLNMSHFGDYKCKVANPLGMLERIIKLRIGQKPNGPSRFQLKRSFIDGLELDIRSVKYTTVPDNMQTIGYRVEYMSEHDFKYSAGNWSYAKRRDFLFHKDGRRFVITKLQTNTTYLMRCASLNLAGLSDWSSVKIFATLTNLANKTVTHLAKNFIPIIALGFITTYVI